jgi:multisubunit Na+/H+ antiporter MnhG subunit
MTKQQLQRFKDITIWAGVVVTFCGIILSLVSGGSWWSGGLSLFGLLVTCCGHLITNAIARHQAAERAADQKKLEDQERDMVHTIKELERRMMMMNR